MTNDDLRTDRITSPNAKYHQQPSTTLAIDEISPPQNATSIKKKKPRTFTRIQALPKLDVIKHIFSLTITSASLLLVVVGIAGSHASLAGPPFLHFLILLFVLVLLAYLEGLQVGFLALNKRGEYGGYSVYNGFNYAVTDDNTGSKLVDAKSDRNW